MSTEWNSQRARELLAASSPGAARAMRAREQEAARRRRTVEEWRWQVVDKLAQQAIEGQSPLVEASPPAEEAEVVDEEAERRRKSLALARMRARAERANRQNDKSESTT
ncbi:hypothetical protein ACQP1V_42910 (plasmid) [Microtetraspora malaysiensis]|uniref:hypothetical protein n=1 Tax=Microtetraspora malaysiensis TaxID=161358 RepID=UPI003D9461A0